MNPILEHVDLKTLILMLGLEMKEHSTYYLGKCPLHSESNPSFSIHKNGFYSCFSCGKSGSISDLVYKLTGKGIYKFLDIADINSYIFTHPKKEENDRSSFPEKNQFIIKGNLLNVYEDNFLVDYLKSRNISNEFIDFFDIKQAKYVDINNTIFKDRVVIPIYENFNIIGYEGRDYTKKQKPKVLYCKRSNVSTLFNIDNLNRKEPLIICEGTWDICQIWSNITKNVTHTFGVKISNRQKELIKEFKQVIIFIDRDEAGFKGLSEYEEFLENEYYICMSKKEGKDPGAMTLDEIKEALDNKIKAVDYFLEQSQLFNQEEIKW